MRSLALLASSVCAAACTSSSHGGTPSDLQMNDLSVLLPLPSSQQDLAQMLSASTPALGGALLPEAVYTPNGDLPYSQLQAVAFRLDPCFGHTGPITDPSLCENQLRVIFQPVDVIDANGGGIVTQDAAVHAFYSITRAQLLEAVDELVAARVADVGSGDLGPLAPNVVIASEGFGGKLAQAYNSIITKYAGTTNFVRFTNFILEELVAETPGQDPPDGGQFWTMNGFDIADGSATAMDIASLPAGTTDVGLSVATQPLATEFSPVTTSADNISLIANYTQAM
jgi:hypothetical protein